MAALEEKAVIGCSTGRHLEGHIVGWQYQSRRVQAWPRKAGQEKREEALL